MFRDVHSMTPAEFGNLFTPIFDEAFTNLVDIPVGDRPAHLAHYTSIGVLEKIILTNEIWFSHPLFMNDHEEMLFGLREGIRTMLHNARTESVFSDLVGGLNNLNELRQQYMKYIHKFDTDFSKDVYVFCLSEYDIETQPDGLLSMWRGYGANGNGVALVFNTKYFTLQKDAPLLFAKVRYGSAQERANWIGESFEKCLRLLYTHGISPEHIRITAWNMFRSTLYHALSSKHPGFKEEEEWRIIYLVDLDVHNLLKDKRSYLIRGNTVEPKLKFPIEPLKLEPQQDWSFDSILDRIVLGPTHASSLALSSARRMLECLGKPEFAKKLWASQIPYRPVG